MTENPYPAGSSEAAGFELLLAKPTTIRCFCVEGGIAFEGFDAHQAHLDSGEHRANAVDSQLQRYARKTFEALKWWVHVESTFQTGNTTVAAFERARDLVAEIQAGFTALERR